jgi:hypothetical protein
MNAVANSIMLQLHLLHHFYNTVFEIKHKLHVALWSDIISLPKEMGVRLNTALVLDNRSIYVTVYNVFIIIIIIIIIYLSRSWATC